MTLSVTSWNDWFTNPSKLVKLVTIAETHTTPCYVYDTATIVKKVDELKKLTSVNRVFYAIKANSHGRIVKLVYEQGVSLECVSINEVRHVFETIDNVDPKRVLFSSNFAPQAEFKEAMDFEVHVTVDNLFPLKNWPTIFRNREIILRLDVGAGNGHHAHVVTGGVHSKFGIGYDDVKEAIQLATNLSCRIVGLHVHTGSGIWDTREWAERLRALCEGGVCMSHACDVVMTKFDLPDVKYLNIGGGLAVTDREEQVPLDLSAVDLAIEEVKKACKLDNVEVWMEPGRYIVAKSGVLLTKVTQTKKKSGTNFVGIDAGMNSLMRPALYQAHHEVRHLIEDTTRPLIPTTIVGPICESADVLGRDRLLAECQEGDVLLIENCGAYAKVMSTEYNLRPSGEEVFI